MLGSQRLKKGLLQVFWHERSMMIRAVRFLASLNLRSQTAEMHRYLAAGSPWQS